MDFCEVLEGTTRFFVPVQDPGSAFPPGTASVFFNRRMELSRDATILLASVIPFSNYLDAMGATGARGLRMAHECGIPVTINDRNREAVSLIRRNAEHVGVLHEITESDINCLLSTRKFDAVDIDPFGTPAPFIDSAARGTGRYLMVTATDTAPLCGAHKKAGIRRYFASAENNEYHAETGLRVLLGFLVREIAKYDRGLEPLFCFVKEHFVRLHVRLSYGAERADRAIARIGYVMQCPNCPFRTEQTGMLPLEGRCGECGSRLIPIGPLWTGGIQDLQLLDSMAAEIKNIRLGKSIELEKLIAICRQELPLSSHYDYHRLTKNWKISPPPLEQVISSLQKEGYAASRAHYSGTALKTDAPLDEIRKIFDAR
jgi:tRNA (guanine26-N2/guanine27-N2)-dimethyltransferase